MMTSLSVGGRATREILSTRNWSPISNVGYMDRLGMYRGSTMKMRTKIAMEKAMANVRKSSYRSSSRNTFQNGRGDPSSDVGVDVSAGGKLVSSSGSPVARMLIVKTRRVTRRLTVSGWEVHADEGEVEEEGLKFGDNAVVEINKQELLRGCGSATMVKEGGWV